MSTAISAPPSPPSNPEQAVVVHFSYGSKNLKKLFALEDKVEAAIKQARTGEYDGHDIAITGADGHLYMYGPDADKLFLSVKPVLEAEPFMRGATVTKRYGPAQSGANENSVVINPGAIR